MNDELKSQMERMEKRVDAAKRALAAKAANRGQKPYYRNGKLVRGHGEQDGANISEIQHDVQAWQKRRADSQTKYENRLKTDPKFAKQQSRAKRQSAREKQRQGFMEDYTRFNASPKPKDPEGIEVWQDTKNWLERRRKAIFG